MQTLRVNVTLCALELIGDFEDGFLEKFFSWIVYVWGNSKDSDTRNTSVNIESVTMTFSAKLFSFSLLGACDTPTHQRRVNCVTYCVGVFGFMKLPVGCSSGWFASSSVIAR